MKTQADKERAYLKGQKKSGIKAGDTVRVLQKAKDYARGWCNSWVFNMTEAVGKKLVVHSVNEVRGIYLSSPAGYGFPYFVLQKICPAHPRYVGKLKPRVPCTACCEIYNAKHPRQHSAPTPHPK